MRFPESVLTRNQRGETEARRLIDSGRFVRYEYVYPETGKQAEKGKLSIILKSDSDGRETHYFLIPIKGNRFLTVIPKDDEKNRKVWDGKKARDLF